MDLYGFPRFFLVFFFGFSYCSWFFMVFHGFSWFFLVVSWFFMVSLGFFHWSPQDSPTFPLEPGAPLPQVCRQGREVLDLASRMLRRKPLEVLRSYFAKWVKEESTTIFPFTNSFFWFPIVVFFFFFFFLGGSCYGFKSTFDCFCLLWYLFVVLSFFLWFSGNFLCFWRFLFRVFW